MIDVHYWSTSPRKSENSCRTTVRRATTSCSGAKRLATSPTWNSGSKPIRRGPQWW